MLLARIGADRSIDPLIEFFFRDEEDVVKLAIIEAFGYFQAPDLVEILLNLLTSPQPELQATAIRSLGRLREPTAVKPVVALLTNEEELVREAAADALGKLGDNVAVEPLLIVVHNETGLVRKIAARSVDRLTASSAGTFSLQLFEGRSGVAEELARLGIPCCIAPLQWTLIEGEPHLRAQCARALGSFDPERVLQALTDALSDEHPEVGESARDSLKRLGGITAPSMLPLIRHPETRVRRLVAEVLAEVGDAHASPALIACLQDKDAAVRIAAATALGRTGGPEAVEPLMQLLTEQDPPLAAAALRSLGCLQCTRAFDKFIQGLDDEDPAIRLASVEALKSLEDPRAIRPLKAVASILNRKELPEIKQAAKDALKVLTEEEQET
jgi:HEAT repeat protein